MTSNEKESNAEQRGVILPPKSQMTSRPVIGEENK